MESANRPFRFSLLTGGAPTRKEWIDRACQAEDLGYTSLLFGEHAFNPLEPVAALAAAAMATTTLRLGSYMFGNDFHNPVQLAQAAATLDVLSEGRLDFGLGTGYLANDYPHWGIPLDLPATRIRRLEEAVRIIKSYFAGQPFEFTGQFYQVKVDSLSPAPFQQPHPKIIMGGGGKQMLSLAAREADQVSFNPRTTRDGWFDFSSVTLEATEQKLAWVRETAGERFARLELSAIVPVMMFTQSKSETLQVVESVRANFGLDDSVMTLPQFQASPHIFAGSPGEVEEKLFAVRERFGISHFVVFEPIEMSQAVVKRMAGR